MKACIQVPILLRRDPRFGALSPGAKWVYGQVCDRGELVAQPGLDVLGTLALVVDGLGDTPREVLAPLLAEIAERGLAVIGEDRVTVVPPTGTRAVAGPRGGLSGAARTAAWRDRQRTREQGVTANPSHNPSRVTSHDPSQSVVCDGVTGESVTQSVTVTDSPSQVPSQNSKRDGVTSQTVTVTESVTGRVPPSALPEVLPSHTLPSPTSPNSPHHTHTNRAREVADSDRSAEGRRAIAADELVVVLRQRAAKHFLAAGSDTRTLVALQRALNDLSAGPLGAVSGLGEILADWYAAGSQGWRDAGRKPSLRELARDGVLAEHIERAVEWDRAGRPAIVHGNARGKAAPKRSAAPVSDWPGWDKEAVIKGVFG